MNIATIIFEVIAFILEWGFKGYVIISIFMFLMNLGTLIRGCIDKRFASKLPTLWKKSYVANCICYLTLIWLPLQIYNKYN
jgi:hypothetical protein